MDYLDYINVQFMFLLVVLVCLPDAASSRSVLPVRDYIATDHFQSASELNEAIYKKPPKELSRKKAFELLYSGSYFQDAFMEQLAPHKLQFGHVFENPREWQQRFEQNDFDENRFQGKVRWGNAKGDYGEHYWDLGHAGRR